MDKRYREELERVRLTEESKGELARALEARYAPPEEGRSRRGRRWSRAALASAAAACILAASVGAAVMAAPVVGRYFGSSPGYFQSAAELGESVTKNGWTMTLTDCVADDFNLYLGITLTGPEDAVLGEEYYYFQGSHTPWIAGTNGGSSHLSKVEDDDPSDNQLHFILWNKYIPHEGMSLNGQMMALTLGPLYHNVWNEEKQRPEAVVDCGATWRFHTTLAYPDNAIRLEPDLTVHTLEVDAVLAEVRVTPLSVFVSIEGDSLKGHHSWVPENAPNGWYGCIDYQEITLYTKDGTAIPLMEDIAGSGCSGGDSMEEEGYLHLVRRPEVPLDMEELASISVCGVEVPLR